MIPYSYEDWGITRTEYERLKDAVAQGIILQITAERRMNELKHGYISVDELIQMFDYSHKFSSTHNPIRSSIEQKEFEEIAASILDKSRLVTSYSFSYMAVEVKISSRSRKAGWMCHLDFDDDGRINGRYSIHSTYPESTQPRVIGDRISRAIHSAMYR